MLLQQDPQERLTPFRTQLAKAGELHEMRVFGRRHVYVDAGKGPAIVLLHGLGGSLYDWRYVIGPLQEAGYRVIAPDLLGAGESDMPEDADYSLVAQARRLKWMLEELKIDKATLVGNSLGGGVAILYALDWTERVDRLVLIDSVCYPEHLPLYVWFCQVPKASELMSKALPTRQMAEWALKSCYKDCRRIREEEVENYSKELAVDGRKEAMVRWVRAAVPVDSEELQERLKKMGRPTLVVWGTADETVPPALGKRLVKNLPNARWVELEAGHLPNQERPQELVGKVREFLGQRVDSAPAEW